MYLFFLNSYDCLQDTKMYSASHSLPNSARTFQNMARPVQSCLDANGDHFQHMLWCRHISYTRRLVRFKYRCSILNIGKIIKEMLGSVTGGTHCTICSSYLQNLLTRIGPYNVITVSSKIMNSQCTQKITFRRKSDQPQSTDTIWCVIDRAS